MNFNQINEVYCMSDVQSKTPTLYEQELANFRAQVSSDLNAIHKYYGFTLLYSLPAEDYLKVREQLNLPHRSAHEFYNFGVLAAQEGRLEQALKHFDQALKLQPQFPEALFNRAMVLEKAGKTQDAVKAWEQYLAAAAPGTAGRSEVEAHLKELKGA
ncbi:MAG: hypothetical protein Kow0059_11780 [Candidatus Sumerlaeia bacterium]